MVTFTPGQISMTPKTPRGSRHYAAPGQALIMAVLVMFLLVGLAGVFIAMISHAMWQTARAEERDRLEAVALAGLHQVQNELLNSPEGADWRPGLGPDQDANNPLAGNPGWIHHGDGFYKVTVTYGPEEPLTEKSVSMTNPLERYIKIDVQASFALKNPPAIASDNPEYKFYQDGYSKPIQRFMIRNITALMPLALTDNLLWVTNLDEAQAPFQLGSGVMVQDNYPTTPPAVPLLTTVSSDPTAMTDEVFNQIATTYETMQKPINPTPYLPVYDGPIRIDGNVELGNLAVYLTNSSISNGDAQQYSNTFHVQRYDQMVAKGNITVLPSAKTAVVLKNHNDAITAGVSLNNANNPDLVLSLNDRPLIRSFNPPLIDGSSSNTIGLDRYRALTRDSGKMMNVTGGASIYSGAIGHGDGLYVNNPDEIQFGRDNEKLFAEWRNPQTGAHWENSVYQPQLPDPVDSNISDNIDSTDAKSRATMLVLHDWELSADNKIMLPYIELRRFDNTPFVDEGNQPLLQNTRDNYYYINVPYPRNGVVFAEGNLVVKGNLPASLAYNSTGQAITDAVSGKQRPGGYRASDGALQYYVDEHNRRFDLTIVSGGTIYLEGNLLGPATRTSNLPDTDLHKVVPGSAQDSKLALLAMDNVCMNPTRLYEADKPVSSDNSDLNFWRVEHATPPDMLNILFSNASDASKMRIFLRHAGEPTTTSGYAAMRMYINNAPYNWLNVDPTSYDGWDKYYFCPDPLWSQLFSASDQQRSKAMLPDFDLLMVTRPTLSGSTWLQGFGATNTVSFSLADEGNLNYLLSAGGGGYGPGLMLSGADVQVDALIYAQRGSWYVIPGPYFNDDKDNADPSADLINWPYPRYHEPQDIKITVNGAIVENKPAPFEAEEDSLMHWRGSNMSYFTDGSATTPFYEDPKAAWDASVWKWSKRRQGIEYHYDATLSRPACYTIETDVDGNKHYRYLPRLPKLPISSTVFSFGLRPEVRASL